jgi:hypothetical protein
LREALFFKLEKKWGAQQRGVAAMAGAKVEDEEVVSGTVRNAAAALRLFCTL